MKKALAKIQNMIYEIRGQKVMLDSDLAELYEVETGALNRAVKRNVDRFPSDFMFQLKKEEWEILKSQFVTLKSKNKVMPNWHNLDNAKFRPAMPYVFTEQGIAMLSGVLNSKIAIQVNIQIMRAFIQLRNYVIDQNPTAQIAELRKMLMVYMENTDYKLDKHDKQIEQIIMVLNKLLEKPPQPKRIGFNT